MLAGCRCPPGVDRRSERGRGNGFAGDLGAAALVLQHRRVGALGSRINNERRRERLLQYFDLSQAEVDRLHGPVGLPWQP